MVVHRSTLKQINRPFKGSTKCKTTKKVKITAKIELVRLPRKKIISDIKKSLKQSRIRLKRLGPKAILLVSCTLNDRSNEFVDKLTDYILGKSLDSDVNINFIKSGWNIGNVVKLPKKASNNNLQPEVYFYSCPRDVKSILSASTIADLIILLFDGITNDEAFDKLGYEILRGLKLQGIPSIIGLNISNKDSNIVRRYFNDELGSDKKFFTLEESYQLIRCISNMTYKQLSWRKDRGYMLAHHHSYDGERLILKGYMRNMGFTCKNMVHVTDIGDFILDRIEIIPQSEISLDSIIIDEVKLSDIQDQLDVYNNLPDIQYDNDRLDEMFDNIAIESNENDELDEYFKQIVNSSKNYEMEIRDVSDRTFPDEVDIPSDILASKRFRKYRALDDFNKSEWDPYMDLPIEYSKIHEFESFKKTIKFYHSQYIKDSNDIIERIKRATGIDTNEPFVYLHLTHIKLNDKKLNDVDQIIDRYIKDNIPFILSVIYPYERKMTLFEMSMTRFVGLDDTGVLEIPSKKEYGFIAGFRRFTARPIFSIERSIGNTGGYSINRSRYLKSLDYNKPCIVSIYGLSLPISIPIIMYDNNRIIANGKSLGSNPRRVILKRIILTGYPIKVHKYKAIVRYMFFNPHDIKWYKPAKLVTKNGLSGRIICSLGTHGYMKCQFNQYISQDDIVMLYLYKRIFPKWNTKYSIL